MMNLPYQTNWAARFAAVTVVCVLALIGIGGLVTSKGAGMAVPDWPTTFGYNMFLFPISQWTGGIFYEHSHRLVASGVGFLTLILAVWLLCSESRRWVKWMGLAALLLVAVQGLLGGLRVTLFKDQLGIVHAALAQVFLCWIACLSFVGSRWWKCVQPTSREISASRSLKPKFILASVLIFAQLILGATLRHQHAGLAVPDFPLAYGKIWPPTDPVFIEKINQARMDSRDFKPISSGHIQAHMAHRVGALVVFAAILFSWLKARQEFVAGHGLRKLANFWLGTVFVQVGLGIVTIWFNKPADIATLHVLVGAICLVTGVLGSVALGRLSFPNIDLTNLAFETNVQPRTATA